LVWITVCQAPTAGRKKRTSRKPHPNWHTARVRLQNQTYPATEAGPKHAAQAHLCAQQTERKSKHRREHCDCHSVSNLESAKLCASSVGQTKYHILRW